MFILCIPIRRISWILLEYHFITFIQWRNINVAYSMFMSLRYFGRLVIGLLLRVSRRACFLDTVLEVPSTYGGIRVDLTQALS